MAETKPDGDASSFEEPLEIPQEDWGDFLQDFSSSHEIWNATIKVLNRAGGREVEIPERPLREIRYDAIHNGNIQVALGPSANGSANEIIHTVIRPTRMSVAVVADVTIIIESADSSVTVVRCADVAEQPDSDGVAA
jgi:hypothetical protein